MLKSLFNQSNQSKIVVLVAFLVLVVVLIEVAGKTELVENADGTTTVQKTVFGYKIGK